MADALIIFGSETGNTEKAASMVAEGLRAKGVDVEVRDVVDTTISVLDEDHGAFVFGVSTWGALEDEVVEDFEPFYEDMADKDMSGLKVAVFGCGDSGYTGFCRAVDYVTNRSREKGAELLVDSLKIDLDPADSKEMVENWAANLADKLK